MSSGGKLDRKESYKAQRRNYRKEKKRVAKELLCTFKDESVIVLADWLKIRGSLKGWTKLWCVLKPGLLILYRSQKAKSSHWIGTIILSSAELIERPSKKDGFCFKLFLAKAIYDNKLLECYFTRSFYKHILAKAVKHQDMESEDYEFYKNPSCLVDNKVEDIGLDDLNFSTEIQEFGVTEVRDLIPNGRSVLVTDSNKADYIRLVCQEKMTGAIRKQLAAFLEGFYDIIPRRLIAIFNE